MYIIAYLKYLLNVTHIQIGKVYNRIVHATCNMYTCDVTTEPTCRFSDVAVYWQTK